MTPPPLPELPVTRILPDLRRALDAGADVVLEAPPGAGKTTLVPLALLDAKWLQGQSIVLVQPRRVAARAAAARMAALLGEKPGQTVGYRIRLESRVSDATRIEVVTEGVLTRRLQQDPGLAGVGLLIFDEFHERNLDAELGLALGLQGRELFREGEPLRLLVMSATLSGIELPRLLPGARVLVSEGRRYPVDLHYRAGPGPGESPVPAVVAAVREALRDHPGHVLVFLPGQAEIRHACRELAELEREDLRLAPLHGGLTLQQQQWAIDLPPEGVRKVVLATNIAETSLTIEGVRVVVDCGLERLARFDPATSTTRLSTRRISRASAEQRAGRAGRLGPGAALRLWSREQQGRLVAQREPEVLRSDLAPLALQLLAWGVSEPGELAWLDTPAPALFQQALDLLAALGALRRGSPPQLTPRGLRLAELPLHPRLGSLLLTGADLGAVPLAAHLAALLEARDPGMRGRVDLQELLQSLERADARRVGWAREVGQQARRYQQLAQRTPRAAAVSKASLAAEQTVAVLVASAWPDHIARARAGAAPGQYQLANGRSAELPGEDPLAGREWLAVAELGGRAGESVDRIWRAASLDPACFETVLAVRVEVAERTVWEGQRLRAWRERRVGALCLSREVLDTLTPDMRADAWLQRLRERGLTELPWTEAARQWCARVDLLRRLDSEQSSAWPATDDAALLERAEDWLWAALCAPEVERGLERLDLLALLQQLLPWPLPRELEVEAPLAVTVPSGAARRIDYLLDSPVLAVKLQEMFGCQQTPRIAWGRQPLLLHLLSPAGRPLAVTASLETFWRDVYPQVRKEMKGRYPKHPWPEDPLTAVATSRTRRREGAA
jgi:ATP-dependent helicase HrpB